MFTFDFFQLGEYKIKFFFLLLKILVMCIRKTFDILVTSNCHILSYSVYDKIKNNINKFSSIYLNKMYFMLNL